MMRRFVDVDTLELNYMHLALDGDAKFKYDNDSKFHKLYDKYFIDRYGRIIDPWMVPVWEYELDIVRLETDYDQCL